MTSPPTDQRFIIASLGSIGQRHLRNLRTLRPNAKIAALRRPGFGADPSHECDAWFSTLQDALAFRPTAAILAGPAPTHVPLAQAFMEQGVPVLIEKPLSHSLADLGTLLAIARRVGVPAMVGYNLRFNPTLASLRAEVKKGAIGDVMAVRADVGQYLPAWRPKADYRTTVSGQSVLGGGALLELSHEIDYIYWLFGMPDGVTARGGRLSALDIDVEDCVELCLEYAVPRRLVSIHLDFLQQPASRTCKLIGSLGTIVWDGMRDRYTVASADPADGERTIEMPMPDRNQMYLDELDAFLTALKGGSAIPIPLDQGVDVMRIIAAARASMDSGATVVPPTVMRAA